MKFEVNKFLTLSALLAGAATAAVACSSTDDKQVTGAGGEGGGAGTSVTAGTGGSGVAGENSAGAPEGGALALGGAGGTVDTGGAAEAGAATGGAPAGGAGEGGAAGDVACIADLVGEGGAAAEGATPCDIWNAVGAPDCGNELGNFASQTCGALLYAARPAVLAAFNACVTTLGDVCNASGVQNCATGLVGRGCTQATTATSCTAITASCTDGSITNCPALLDLTTADTQAAAKDCMDPAGETYDATFSGTCDNRLLACLHLGL